MYLAAVHMASAVATLGSGFCFHGSKLGRSYA